MPKKPKPSKTTTPHNQVPATKPGHKAVTRKKAARNKKTTARANSLAKADRAALEAKAAEFRAKHPRAAAAMDHYFEISRCHGKDSPEAKLAYRLAEKLANTFRNRTSPAAVCMPALTPKDPREAGSVKERDQLHHEIFAGGVYTRLVKPLVNQIWGS